MIVAEVIARARTIAKDIDAYRWTDQELLDELNDIILEIGNELQLFKGEESITIFNGQSVYNYSQNTIELLEIRVDNYNGAVVLPSSLQTFRATGRTNSGDSLDPFNTNFSGSTRFATVAFSDTVNYGQIRLDPTPSAETSDLTPHIWTP